MTFSLLKIIFISVFILVLIGSTIYAKTHSNEVEYVITNEKDFKEIKNEYLQDVEVIKAAKSNTMIKNIFGELDLIDKTKSSKENIKILISIVQDGSSIEQYAAYQELRNFDIYPSEKDKLELLGYITEIEVDGNIEYLAVYDDGNIIYINKSGDIQKKGYNDIKNNTFSNDTLQKIIDDSTRVVKKLGSRPQERLSDLPKGYVRFTFLTPSGITCGMGPTEYIKTDIFL